MYFFRIKMPKAKFKRKGATVPLFEAPNAKKTRLSSDSSDRIELDPVDYPTSGMLRMK